MIVRHWRYDDGREKIFNPKTFRMDETDEIDESIRGWHCWVWLNDIVEGQRFHNWLQLHIHKGYDTCRRFNSGDPMTELYIKDDVEAKKFSEYWGDHFERIRKTAL